MIGLRNRYKLADMPKWNTATNNVISYICAVRNRSVFEYIIH